MNRETLSVPREESLPVPFNHIDVVRHTQHTFGHITRTKNDDHWKVDGERPLSGFWIGFTNEQEKD